MKKKYPSQKKYEEENPLTCFRSKKDEKESIITMAKESKKSLSDLVRMSLLDQVQDFSNAIAAAEKRGYEKGKEDWALWIYCKICDEAIFLQPNTEVHGEIIEFIKQRGGSHPQCH